MKTVLQTLYAESEKTKLVDTLLFQIKALGLSTPEREYMFHPTRRFRADLCYPELFLIFECDGGIYMEKAGHTTGVGYESDRRRDCEAFLLGFKVVRFTESMVEDGTAVTVVEKLFKGAK